MSTIDSRVVEMNFDGSKFGSGVQNTLSALDRLKAGLHLGGASQGLKDINAAAQNFNGAPMEQGVGRISASFTALQAVAFGALANIGAKISSMAMNMANEFTLAPISAGFSEYELKMGSIQTMLANTVRHGTSLETINTELGVLNDYADQTIYNFGDMTTNIGKFTAAGIKIEDATAMIKGFSNAAAAAGTDSTRAAGAAHQLSQSLSDGKITLETWNSLSQAGMGNKNMQESLVLLADKMGHFEGKGIKAADAQKGFNKSLEKGWLHPDVMSKYLQIMTADMTDAEVAALGMNDAQVKMLQDQAKMGLESATKVRTFTALMGSLKESVGSGWAETFEVIFGDFNEATELFTNISNAVGGFAGRMTESRNVMLEEWKHLGGRTALIEGVTEAFWALGSPLAQVGMAFRDVFPAMTASRLSELTHIFRDLMVELRPSPETLDRLRRTFAGVFAILGIGWEILKAVVGFFGKLFMGLTEGDQGILRITASIGDFLVGLHKAIKAGAGFGVFADRLLGVIFKIINPIRDAGQALGKMFEGVELGGLGEAIGKFISTLLAFGSASDKASDKASGFKEAVGGFFEFFIKLAKKVADFIEPVTSAIGDALGNINFDQLNQALQTLSLGGIAIFLKQIGGMFSGFSIFQNDNGFFDQIKQSLDNVTGTLSAMQANLKASMLLKIAGAIALLAVSVVLLASVDGPGLARATAALTVMFIQLGVAMMAFQKIGTIASIAKLSLMGAALILISIAILLLAGAVKVLASMSWEELAKGLGALVILMGVIIGLSRGLDKSRGAIIRSAVALIIMAAAIKMLIDPIKQLGSMDLDTLRQGLIAVGALLAGLALFSRLARADSGAMIQGAGMLLLAKAISELANAVKTFGQMSVAELEKGFAAVAAGLTMMGIALRFMPSGPMVILTALAIGKVAGALVLMAKAFKAMDEISWETIFKGMTAMGSVIGLVILAMQAAKRVSIVKAAALYIVVSAIQLLGETMKSLSTLNYDEIGRGLTALAGTMIILTAAMRAMQGSVAGAAALLLVAVALRVLLPVITTLGSLPIPVIVTALAALAGVFIVLGVAAWALAPVTPVLLALGFAIALIGGAMVLAGAGTLLFAMGLTALAAAGGAGVAALIAVVSGLIGLIPMIATQIGKGIVALLVAIGESGAQLTIAFVQIVSALLDGIIILAPKFGQAFLVLLITGLHILVQSIPRFVQAGFDILLGVLNGIANNIGRIVDVAARIITNFIDGLSRNMGRIIQSGIEFIISFVNGLADGIRRNSRAMGEAGGNLASAMVEGMITGLGSMAGKLIAEAKKLAERAWNAAKDWLGIQSPSRKFMELGEYSGEGLALGIEATGDAVAKSAEGVGQSAIDGMKKTISGLGALVSGDMDMTPVIAPVLDLTDVRKSAAGIGALLEAKPLNVGSSYSGASDAAAGYRSNQEALAETDTDRTSDNITFIQNNTSPKALSSADIYRQTKNQISVAKGALTSSAK